VLDRKRLLRQPEVAARNGRNERDLVTRGECLRALDVDAIAGVQQALRLGPELEARPDVTHGRAVGELHLERAGARTFPESGKQAQAYVHREERSRRLPPCP